MAFERCWTALARQNSARLWINRLEKSPHLCLAGLRIRRFDPISGASELPDHSRGALLLGLFGDRRAPFFVTNSLVQDQPDQATLSMGIGPDGWVMSQARDRPAIRDLEDASLWSWLRRWPGLRTRRMWRLPTGLQAIRRFLLDLPPLALASMAPWRRKLKRNSG